MTRVTIGTMISRSRTRDRRLRARREERVFGPHGVLR
ncbi:hypothetical protein Ae505Ps2_1867c [Pseudonocardia sp. Ae505_Ps2]|nr:hypothetical protein Ae505Ps2_1867c [Pseudonocardia sp. Ae505_Ps2]